MTVEPQGCKVASSDSNGETKPKVRSCYCVCMRSLIVLLSVST